MLHLSHDNITPYFFIIFFSPPKNGEIMSQLLTNITPSPRLVIGTQEMNSAPNADPIEPETETK